MTKCDEIAFLLHTDESLLNQARWYYARQIADDLSGDHLTSLLMHMGLNYAPCTSLDPSFIAKMIAEEVDDGDVETSLRLLVTED
jgi:hypothetical protein